MQMISFFWAGEQDLIFQPPFTRIGVSVNIGGVLGF